LSSAIPQAVLAGIVQNCGDGGPGSGSLRDTIASAQPSETIDLSQLQSKCGTKDSLITLSNGEITIPQNDLKLQGPLVGSVTIQPEASRIASSITQGRGCSSSTTCHSQRDEARAV
jgi:hypothetical protein